MQNKGVTIYLTIMIFGLFLVSCMPTKPNEPPRVWINGMDVEGNSVTVSWDGEDPDGEILNYYIGINDSINMETVDSRTTEKTFTGLGTGEHWVYLKAKDNEDSESELVEEDFSVDIALTGITLLSPENNSEFDHSNITFEWSAIDGANGYKIEIDSTSDENFQKPVVSREVTDNQFELDTNLADGNYHWRVAAKNSLDTFGEWSSPWNFVIQLDPENDTESPVVEIVSGPADSSVISTNSVTFEWNGTDDTSPEASLEYRYKLNNSSWSQWSDLHSTNYTGLDNGEYTFRLEVRDLAGNVGDNQRFFTVENGNNTDTTDPTVTIEKKDITGSSISITWSGNDNGTSEDDLEYQYRLDEGEWSGWSGTTTAEYNDLSKGEHAFSVKVRDESGNLGITNTFFTIEDTDPPTIEITQVSVNGYEVTISWSGEDDLSSQDNLEYQYRLNEQDWFGWSAQTEKTFSDLDVGQYTFQVKVRDGARNESDVASETFTVEDVTDPEVTINDPQLQGAKVTFTWSGSDNVTSEENLRFRYRLDQREWSDWSQQKEKSYNNLDVGNHSFQVEAQDEKGNKGDASHEFEVVDTNPPSVNISDPDINGNGITFSWNGSDEESSSEDLQYRYRLSGEKWSDWSGQKEKRYEGLNIGDHTFQVEVRDNAGNVGSASKEFTVEDTQAPVVSIDDPVLRDDEVIISWSGKDNVTSDEELEYRFQMDGVHGEDWSGWKKETEETFKDLDYGQHTFLIQVRDKAENVGEASLEFSNEDNQDPSVSVTQFTVNNYDLKLSWSGNDDITTTKELEYRHRLDDNGWSDWNDKTEAEYKELSIGDHHIIEIEVRDLADNRGSVTRQFTVEDVTDPTVTINQPTWFLGYIIFSWSGKDNYTPKNDLMYRYQIDNGNWTEWISTTDVWINDIKPGKHLFKVQVRDVAGNTGIAEREFIVRGDDDNDDNGNGDNDDDEAEDEEGEEDED